MVIGAGVVGLACAYALTVRGQAVTVIDPDPDGDKASFGNACALAVTDCAPLSVPGLWRSLPAWLLDPLGPLSIRPTQLPGLMPWFWSFLRNANIPKVQACAAAQWQLNNRVWQDFEPFLHTIGYAAGVTQKGMLKVFNQRHNYDPLALEWQIKRDQGFTLELIEREQLKAMEPALSDAKQFAVFHPQWRIVDDPKQLLANCRHWLQAQGVQFVRDEITSILHTDKRVKGVRGKAQNYACEQLVVAAGAWSAKLARTVGERCLLASERGYNTTIAAPGIELNHMLFFAEEQFVATPMGLGLRIGGAAEFAGLAAPPNYQRSRALLTKAQRCLPDLVGGEGEMWMGQRPSTPDTLPVLGPSLRCAGLHYAFGHGHLGLTQSVTSGELVAQALLEGKMEALQPFSIARFA
jgi:D-amino-acid dehydrogenase